MRSLDYAQSRNPYLYDVKCWFIYESIDHMYVREIEEDRSGNERTKECIGVGFTYIVIIPFYYLHYPN